MESGNGGKDFNQLSTALVVRSRVLGLEVSGGIPEGGSSRGSYFTVPEMLLALAAHQLKLGQDIHALYALYGMVAADVGDLNALQAEQTTTNDMLIGAITGVQGDASVFRAQLAELAQLEGRLQHAEGAAVHLLGFKNASIAKFAELEGLTRSQAAALEAMRARFDAQEEEARGRKRERAAREEVVRAQAAELKDMHARLERLEEEGRAAERARAAREASAAATPPEPQAAPAAPQAPRRRRSWRLGALLRPLAKVAAWLPLCGNSSAVTD